MLFMPLNFLLMWLMGFLSIGLLGGGLYIVYEWYEGVLKMSYLYGGAALVLWSFAGHFLSLPLLRRPGKDEPKSMRTGTVQRVSRPDGSVLQVEFYGPEDGQPLILVHGWGPNSTVWYYAKRQLSDRFRVIVWDLPGLGKSTPPTNNDYSLEKFARDLEAVLDLVGDQPAIIAGHSLGGMSILTFCRLFPEHLGQRVAGLILVDTTYINPVKTSIFSKFLRTVQKPLLEPLLHLAIWLAPVVSLMNWLSYLNGMLYFSTELSGFTGSETRGQLHFATLLSAKSWPGVVARGTLAMFDFDETATLASINIPVLLIVGNCDRATIPGASIRMKAELDQSELYILKPAGHMGLMEQNQQFAEAVNAFTNTLNKSNTI
ncbi:MAG: alpha/beta hydrolase [Coleofasciculaceae cyanobacterium]